MKAILCAFLLGTAQAQPNVDAWVARISAAPVQDLSGLRFSEMNLAKNAVISAKGYTYAKDRPWLHSYFHGQWQPSKSCAGDCQRWSLAQVEFPMPRPGQKFALDPVQIEAIAKIRQAYFKKLRGYKNAAELREAVQAEFASMKSLDLLGRAVALKPEALSLFEESVIRDELGDFAFLRIVDRIKAGDYRFDMAELVGLYIGNVAFLKQIIEVKNGKAVDPTLTWELAQLGIAGDGKGYSPEKLPADAKRALEALDAAIERLGRSDLGDLPGEFSERIKIDDKTVSYAVGM